MMMSCLKMKMKKEYLKMKMKKECLKKTINNYHICNLDNIPQQMKYKHQKTFKTKKLTKLIRAHLR